MFTSSEIKNIMSESLNDMRNLLKDLGFVADSQCSYSDIDTFITREVCRLMKSESIPEGYSFLLRAGGIPVDFSETPNERLAKVVDNRHIIEPAIIMRGNISSSPQYENRFSVSPRVLREISDIKNDMKALGDIAEEARYLDEGKILQIRKDFRDKFLSIEERIASLPDSIILKQVPEKYSFSEREFIDFIREQPTNYTFTVSIRREKVETHPDQSMHFRKFTAQEAARMFEILEKINDLVRKI